jgi:cyclic pyranopterin phosphate synthase
MKDSKKLTHLDASGKMKMVDVSEKQPTLRVAVARGKITMNDEAYQAIKENRLEKGEALAAARLAGIMAAKKTAELIPLCHPLKLSSVSVEFSFYDENRTIEAEAIVRGVDVTGMEMEALTAVSISLLTLYDMAKALDKSMLIHDIKLVYKSGGKSGTYLREGERFEGSW